MESTIYTVNDIEFELRHFGVKGMKWGRRKARPVGVGRQGRQAVDNSPEAQAARKEARRQKAKRAAMIGGALVAAGLAAYGAKKLNDVIRDKNYQVRMRQAKRHVDSYMNSGMFDKHPGMSTKDMIRADRERANFIRDVVDNYGRKADSDNLRTAVGNVTRDYIDRAKIQRAKIPRAKVGRASW